MGFNGFCDHVEDESETVHLVIWGEIKPRGLLGVAWAWAPSKPLATQARGLLGVARGCSGFAQGLPRGLQKSFNYLLEIILSQPRANPGLLGVVWG